MSLFGRGRGCRFGNIRGRIRAELCRIDIRCVIAGAVIVLLSGFLSALAAGAPTLTASWSFRRERRRGSFS